MLVIAVQGFGGLLSLLGLIAIFLTWRRKDPRQGLWRYGLPAGWALIAAGLIVWMLSTHADQGLALGLTAFMLLACAMVARQGLMLMGQPAKVQRVRQIESDGMQLGKGYAGRVAIRLIGCLLVVPVFGCLAGLVWRVWVPGDEADRLVGLGIVAMIAMTAGLVIQLSSRRPYRSFASLTLASLIIAILVFLPRLFA